MGMREQKVWVSFSKKVENVGITFFVYIIYLFFSLFLFNSASIFYLTVFFSFFRCDRWFRSNPREKFDNLIRERNSKNNMRMGDHKVYFYFSI